VINCDCWYYTDLMIMMMYYKDDFNDNVYDEFNDSDVDDDD
jgi:hypothetical protein